MRHQLPGYSPLTVAGLARGYGAALFRRESPVRALRRELEAEFGPAHCILTGSGTQALQLALEIALERTAGADRPVALPAYACFDLVTAAAGARAPLVFYDIDPHTLAPDLQSLEKALEHAPSAIVGANYCGFPLDWDRLREMGRAADALIVEDAAQGLGSQWEGRAGGTFGDLTVLSFGRGKGWTGGGGGALLVRDPALDLDFATAHPLATSGVAREVATGLLAGVQWLLGRPFLYGLPRAVPGTGLGDTVYRDPVRPAQIPRMAAALVRSHASAARAQVAGRRVRATLIRELLERLEAGMTRDTAVVSACRPLPGGVSSYLRFPVLARNADAAGRIAHLCARAGVARGYPRPLPVLPAARALQRGVAEVPQGAAQLALTLLTLPTHALVSKADMAVIAGVLQGETRTRN